MPLLDVVAVNLRVLISVRLEIVLPVKTATNDLKFGVVTTTVSVPLAGAVQLHQMVRVVGASEIFCGSPGSLPAARVEPLVSTGNPINVMRFAKLSLEGRPTLRSIASAKAVAPESSIARAVIMYWPGVALVQSSEKGLFVTALNKIKPAPGSVR